jgi:hypothetical protein
VTVYTDNAAGRLHQLIEGFRRNVGQSQQSIPHAWAAALNIGGDPSPGFLRRLSYLVRLPDEIKHEMALVDADEYDGDFALRWERTIPGQLEQLFTGNQAGHVASAMNATALNALEYCSYVLHRHRRQRVFTTIELDNIRELIRELASEVEDDTKMSPSLRDFLCSHVLAMSTALDELGLRGPAALEDAFDQAVGAVQRRTDLTTRIEDNKSAWTKFQNLLIGVAAILQITTTAFVLPGQVRQELEGPPPSQPSVVEVIQVPPHEPALVVPKAEKVPQSQGAG